jgi:hypothetical protein
MAPIFHSSKTYSKGLADGSAEEDGSVEDKATAIPGTADRLPSHRARQSSRAADDIGGLSRRLLLRPPEFSLPTAGRSPDSLVTNDLMGVPLGIRTGVGSIDAGVIIRRNKSAVGMTTAPTLWSMTAVGLRLGGGQIELDVVTAAIGLPAPGSDQAGSSRDCAGKTAPIVHPIGRGSLS